MARVSAHLAVGGGPLGRRRAVGRDRAGGARQPARHAALALMRSAFVALGRGDLERAREPARPVARRRAWRAAPRPRPAGALGPRRDRAPRRATRRRRSSHCVRGRATWRRPPRSGRCWCRSSSPASRAALAARRPDDAERWLRAPRGARSPAGRRWPARRSTTPRACSDERRIDGRGALGARGGDRRLGRAGPDLGGPLGAAGPRRMPTSGRTATPRPSPSSAPSRIAADALGSRPLRRPRRRAARDRPRPRRRGGAVAAAHRPRVRGRPPGRGRHDERGDRRASCGLSPRTVGRPRRAHPRQARVHPPRRDRGLGGRDGRVRRLRRPADQPHTQTTTAVRGGATDSGAGVR